MIRLSPILVVPTSWIVCCALLLPVAAQAECLQWDISGRWRSFRATDTTPPLI